jgi:hypothetical protein
VVGGNVQAVEAEAELADDGVVEELDGGGVEGDVVDGPVGAERVALRRDKTTFRAMFRRLKSRARRIGGR